METLLYFPISQDPWKVTGPPVAVPRLTEDQAYLAVRVVDPVEEVYEVALIEIATERDHFVLRMKASPSVVIHAMLAALASATEY